MFPGYDSAESIAVGPEIVQVSFGNSIPFIEDWSSASFQTQQWDVESINWIFDFSIGNPAPSAEFISIPALTNYNYGIISYPILGSEIVNEEIYLEFDYMLDDNNFTGLEFMTVKIWENGVWHEVANYANEGDIDWTTEHIDISEFALGNDFKVGFFANGTNSMDIEGWYIDNINVYSECKAPSELTAEVEPCATFEKVYLNWKLDPPIGEWLQYDDGTNGNSIGLEVGGAFEVSAYWSTSTMEQYIGTNLTEVEVYINDPTITAMIKIYGEGTATEPGALLAEKAFDGVATSWITVVLDSPILIAGEDMWIGYYGDAPASGANFAGTDSGPAVAGFGDMISMDGITFESMADSYGFDYNWNIHGFLTDADGGKILVKPVKATPVVYSGGIPAISKNNTAINTATNRHRDFVSFNIYRNFNEAGYELLEEGITDYTYIDTVYYWDNNWTSYYYVIAIYDHCISNFSNEVIIIIFPPGIDENNPNNLIQIFPNPSVNNVYINSKVGINKITVFDEIGKLVYEKKVVEDNNIKINTSSFESGVYFVKIYTNEGVVVRRVAITK